MVQVTYAGGLESQQDVALLLYEAVAKCVDGSLID